MEIFPNLIENFSQTYYTRDWAEIQSIFERAASAKPKHWLLPMLVCESVGGKDGRAFPAVMATACGHIGIILVDDMLDADPRGVHLKAGEAATANMMSALQSAAGVALSQSAMPLPLKLRALEAVNEMFLATSLGQYWDVNLKIEDEEMYWKVARAKSSPFFSAAFELGALAGGASVELAARIKELGAVYGEMIQVHDDLDDSLAVPARPDWDAGRASLPILFAQWVDHPSRSRFGELRPHVCEQPSALEEAQGILIECGAVSYCIDQLLQRHAQAREVIVRLALERRNVMEAVFDDLARPVFDLLKGVAVRNETPPAHLE